MHSTIVGRDAHVPAQIPTAGLVVSIALALITISVLTICLARRIETIKDWSRVPLTRWLTLAVYSDSILFIFTTGILEHGFGLNSSPQVCSVAIYLCLAFYMSTKVLIYYFLVEKVFIIRRAKTRRLKSKLYCFNCFGMLLPYCVIVAINFVWRRAYFNENGTCIIGMETKVMMPLIIFDAIVNFYLTMLFVLPIRSLYSYKNSPNSTLRTIALRSFVGSLATLTSSVVNLTILMVLRGEAAWICLMCCNADILFSVLVLHWVTSKDSKEREGNRDSGARGANRTAWHGGGVRGGIKVTTLISAVGERAAVKGEGSPVDGIKVQSEQAVEIEGGSVGSGGHGSELERGCSHTTIEDLVEKPGNCVVRNRY